MKKVSIVVPVYNVETFLDECIVSLIHQTYKNIEIILVDDGSLDNSGKKCDKWAKKDDRIIVIHKKNGGLSDARNAGIKIARGDFLTFVDGNDWVSINFIENLMHGLIKFDADMAICKFAYGFPDGTINLNSKMPKKPQILTRKEFFTKLVEDNEITNHVWQKLYKKELFDNVLFPVGKKFEDISVMPKVGEQCKRIVNLPYIGYFYRQNDKKIVNAQNISNYLEAKVKADKYIVKLEPSLKDYVQTLHVQKDFEILDDLNNAKDNGEKLKKIRQSVIKDIKLQHYALNKLSLPVHKKILFYYEQNFSFLHSKRVQALQIKKKLHNVNQVVVRHKKIYTLVKQFKDIKAIGKPVFLIISTPTYGNLGDEALKFGEIKFVNTYFTNYSLFLLSMEDLYALSAITKLVDKKDIVALHAGGNIGTLYPGIQKAQMNALSFLKDKKTIVFPQTLYFSDTQYGKEELEKTYKVFSSISKLKVFVRDEYSKKLISKYFKGISVELVPDIALFLTPKISKKNKRNGALTLLRKDSERTLTTENKDKILSFLEKEYSKIQEGDMHLYYDDLSEEESKKAVEGQLKKVASSEVVITDRLHGMIYCALTNTPCIVVKSQSPKIQGVYQWVKDNDFIVLAENIEEIPNLLVKLKSKSSYKFNRENIDNSFKKMAEMIREL